MSLIRGFQEVVGLCFRYNGNTDTWRGHVDVQLASNQQPHCCREPRVGLHYLRRLLLDNEGPSDQVAQEVGDLSGQLLGGDGDARIVLKAGLEPLEVFDMLPGGPDDHGQGLAPFLERLKALGHLEAVASQLLFSLPGNQLLIKSCHEYPSNNRMHKLCFKNSI